MAKSYAGSLELSNQSGNFVTFLRCVTSTEARVIDPGRCRGVVPRQFLASRPRPSLRLAGPLELSIGISSFRRPSRIFLFPYFLGRRDTMSERLHWSLQLSTSNLIQSWTAPLKHKCSRGLRPLHLLPLAYGRGGTALSLYFKCCHRVVTKHRFLLLQPFLWKRWESKPFIFTRCHQVVTNRKVFKWKGDKSLLKSSFFSILSFSWGEEITTGMVHWISEAFTSTTISMVEVGLPYPFIFTSCISSE